MKKIITIFLLFCMVISHSSSAKIFSEEAVEYRLKGYLAWQNKDYDEAIKYLQKACLLDTCYAPPHNDLGIIYEMKGWLERAEKEYLRALDIDPNYGEAIMNLALLYISQGLTDKAIGYLQKRIEIGPAGDPWVLKAKSLLSQYAPELYKEISKKEEAKNLMYQALEEKKIKTVRADITGKEKPSVPSPEPELVKSQQIENYLRLERDLLRQDINNYLLGLHPEGIVLLYGQPYQKINIGADGEEFLQPEEYNRWIANSE
ncbi:MAG: tetratricopeptide repeat protein, partial [Candidatus Omnitrophota bacterium]